MINKYVCVDCEKLWSPLNSFIMFIMFYHTLKFQAVLSDFLGLSVRIIKLVQYPARRAPSYY
jgi:hypothetical protein